MPARRFRAVGRQHHALGLLEDLAIVVLLFKVGDAGGAASGIDIDLAHIAVHADLAIAGGDRDRQQRHGRGRARLHLAAIARAHAAIDAGAAAIVGHGDDGRHIGCDGQVQLGGRLLHQRAGTFQRQRRAGIGPGHRRDQRRLQVGAADADFPFGLGVIGLQLGIAHRPVGDAGAGHGAEARSLVEFPRQVPPGRGAVGDGAAADDAAVIVVAGRGFLARIAAEGVLLDLGIGQQHVVFRRKAVAEFVLAVVLLMAIGAPGPLLHHNDAEAGLRQLLGHHAAGGAGTDDHEIHFFAGCIFLHGIRPCHRRRTGRGS
jgi:hypothetical protein